MLNLNSSTSIITLNVNGQNTPIKRQSMLKWIKKQNPIWCFLWKSNLKYEDMDRLKGSKIKKIHIYIYTHIHTHTMPKQLVKKRKREKYISLSFLFIHLNSKRSLVVISMKRRLLCHGMTYGRLKMKLH